MIRGRVQLQPLFVILNEVKNLLLFEKQILRVAQDDKTMNGMIRKKDVRPGPNGFNSACRGDEHGFFLPAMLQKQP